MNRKITKRHARLISSILLILLSAATIIWGYGRAASKDRDAASYTGHVTQLIGSIPEYSGEPYTVLNENKPLLTSSEGEAYSYEKYGPLDSLGRCSSASACIGRDLMPTVQRGSIEDVKPSGWHSVRYSFIDGESLYNRCHLIGWQLTAEDANERNLITGTRYLNVEGMLPYENLTAEYIKITGNHVLYRVTPVFEKNELVARGVIMEGLSVEDDGAGICFCIYVFNVQPGIEIDYKTGGSRLAESASSTKTSYVINVRSMKFHYPSCSSVADIAEHNRRSHTGTRDELISGGYSPCDACRP